MDETRDRIEGWDSRPIEDRAALRRLADRGFTGAVVDGDAVLFLLNGRAVGSVGRAVDGFDGGTAREAPDPSLPLLFAMQAADGETWTRGYTNDAPLEEVDETLQTSNFTGYVELSENVLSGEYYMIYYGGQPLYAAFVGPDSELLTGEEAFERAADEVGIYEVIDVDLDVEDVPEPESGAGGTAVDDGGDAAAAGAAGAADGSDASDPDSAPESATDGATAATDESAADSDATAGSDSAGEAAADPTEAESEPAPRSGAEPEPEPGAEPDSEAEDGEVVAGSEAGTNEGGGTGVDAPGGRWPSHSDEDDAGETPAADSGSGSEPTRAQERPESGDAAATGEPTDATADGVGADPGRSGDDGVFAEEEAWRETTAIPALSPDETETAESDADADGWPQPGDDGGQDRSESRQTPTGGRADRATELREELESRTRELEAARERIESLTADLESERETRQRLEAELSELREERNDLRGRIETLEEELAAARAGAATTDRGDSGAETGASAGAEREESADDRSIGPERALAETNLFVRYESRERPTLEEVTDRVDREAVTANLRLDNHTQFDTEGVTVEGVPFEEFLQSTPEYRFVRWAVTELPFEIRDTGHESGLADLYGVLPDVDRAELHGAIEVKPGPETEAEGMERREFDVVLRDRMGNPLVVADINARRDPVTGDMMDDLVDAAAAVEVRSDADVGGALYVTESFFAPDALEAAEEVTGGGFLSRSSKESYVRTDRKRGFHLCLVESRDDSFYVTVPEL